MEVMFFANEFRLFVDKKVTWFEPWVGKLGKLFFSFLFVTHHLPGSVGVHHEICVLFVSRSLVGFIRVV